MSWVAVSVAISAVSLGMSAYSSQQQADYQSKIADRNAQIAENQAQEALARGEQDVIEIQRRGAALRSAQRASLGAKGIDLGYGTAADLQDQTDFFTQADVATARTNARKNALGYQAQAGGFAAEGANARYQGNLATTSSMLSAAGTVAGKWAAYKSPSTAGSSGAKSGGAPGVIY